MAVIPHPPDRADAPKQVVWRGKTLKRRACLSYGSFVRHDNAFYDSEIEYSVDGGRAWLELCDPSDGEGHTFEGTGANEIEALDAAALLMEAWLADLTRVLKGGKVDV
jgi:hypothetical protein